MDESKHIQDVGIEKERNRCNLNYDLGSTDPIYNTTTGEKLCPAFFDEIFCWPPTLAGTLVVEPCPPYIAGYNKAANASRYCTENGTWFFHTEYQRHWTNYTQCLVNDPTVVVKIPNDNVTFAHVIPVINIISHTGYTISFCALIIAFAVMLTIKRLHCPRNKLHMHLFMSFILKIFFTNLKVILFIDDIGLEENFIMKDGKLYFSNGNWRCKLIVTVWEFFITANYSWILMEGLYLHNLIFRALFADSDRNILRYIILGWALPVFVIIPWVITRIIYEDTFCWTTHKVKFVFLIIRIPTMISVLINFVLFIRITRVIYSKLQAPIYEEARRYQKWAKSTLVLVPLFGIHYALFIVLSYFMDEHDITQLVWIGCDQFFASFQGLFVAVLYCFLNAEVKTEIKPYIHAFLTTWATHSCFGYIFPCREKYLRSGRGRPSVCTTMSCSSLYNNGIGPHRGSRAKWEMCPKTKRGSQDKDHVCKPHTRSWHEVPAKWLQDHDSKDSQNRSSHVEVSDEKSVCLILDCEKSKSEPHCINETSRMLPSTKL